MTAAAPEGDVNRTLKIIFSPAVGFTALAAMALYSAFLHGGKTASEPLSCMHPQIIGAVERMTKRITVPLIQVETLKVYNYRPNPDLFTDTTRPCKVNLFTDHGEFSFAYGWKVIEGQVYVSGQIGEPE